MENRSELISALYGATLSPDNFNQFTEQLEKLLIEAALERADDAFGDGDAVSHFAAARAENSPLALLERELSVHIDLVRTIQGRIGHARSRAAAAALVLKAIPCPAYVFSEGESIVEVNALAAGRPGPAARDLGTLVPDPEALAQIRAFMAGEGEEMTVIPFAQRSEGGRQSQVNLLVKEIDAGFAAGIVQGRAFLLILVDFDFDDATRDAFRRAYGLTEAEATVSVLFAGGMQLSEIAAERAVSMTTLRTQVKSIKSKTGIRDLPDLVRLLYGFSTGMLVTSKLSEAGALPRPRPVLRRAGQMVLRDGRHMHYLEQGSEDGEPVLLFHTFPYGVELPHLAIEEAARQNLRIIAPYRPGHGHSDVLAGARHDVLLDAVASDCRELVNKLKLRRVRVLCHGGGSVFGLRFCTLNPDCATVLVLVSHAPIWQDAWLANMPRRHRLVLYIARHFASLLPVFAWSILAYMNKGSALDFLRQAVVDSRSDIAALDNPETAQLVAEGVETGLLKGVEAFCHESELTLDDHTEEARNLKVKIRLLHGDDDYVFRLDYVRAFAEQVPGASLEVIPGTGTFLFYEHWQQMIATLAAPDLS